MCEPLKTQWPKYKCVHPNLTNAVFDVSPFSCSAELTTNSDDEDRVVHVDVHVNDDDDDVDVLEHVEDNDANDENTVDATAQQLTQLLRQQPNWRNNVVRVAGSGLEGQRRKATVEVVLTHTLGKKTIDDRIRCHRQLCNANFCSVCLHRRIQVNTLPSTRAATCTFPMAANAASTCTFRIRTAAATDRTMVCTFCRTSRTMPARTATISSKR